MSKIRTESVEKVRREAAPDEEVLDLRGQVADMRRRLDEYKRDTGSLKSFFHLVLQHLDRVKAEPSQYRPPRIKPGKVRINSPVAAVAQWNDWHVGKVQPADEIEGFGEFSPELAKLRMRSYCESFQKWVQAHRSVYTVGD